jgi:hypothetical protein
MLEDGKKEPPAVEPDPVKSFWARQFFKSRLGKVVPIIFALVVVLAAFLTGFNKIVEVGRSLIPTAKRAWPATPLVVFIYPNSEFGLLRKKGFERGIKTFADRRAFHEVYLAASFDKLKDGDVSEIKDELVGLLKTDPVVAVVAPSITEATKPIINLVRETHRDIPIIIESSVDPNDVNWQEDGHLFRLSSGVDARGAEIGRVIEPLVRAGRPTAIIAEDSDHGYGGRMLYYAENAATVVDSVPKLRYAPGSLPAKLAGALQRDGGPGLSPEEKKAIKVLQDEQGVVFFLGVGIDMEPLLKLAYSEAGPLKARAKLVGVMNAYKLAALYGDDEAKIKSHLIYEVTDFDFIFPFNPPPEVAAFQQTFSNSQALTPVLRDQAYSYDEAALLSEAVRAVSHDATSYTDGLSRVDAFLHNYTGRGVTGNIAIKQDRGSSASPVPRGQNVGSMLLRLAVYRQDRGEWMITSTSYL